MKLIVFAELERNLLSGLAAVWPGKWNPFRLSYSGMKSAAKAMVSSHAGSTKRVWIFMTIFVFMFMWVVQHEEIVILRLVQQNNALRPS